MHLAAWLTERSKLPERLFAQPKLDGWRTWTGPLGPRGAVVTASRSGRVVERASAAALELEPRLAGRWIVDAELVGRRLYAFDLIALDDRRRGRAIAPYAERFERLRSLVAGLERTSLVETVEATAGDLPRLAASYLADGYEGLIVRDPRAGYHPWVRGRGLWKHKPWHDAACPLVAADWGIALTVKTPGGPQRIAPQPHVWDELEQLGESLAEHVQGGGRPTLVVEVRHLGRTRSGRLKNPEVTRLRADL